jgi:type IV pilus assembly protein PilM
VGRWRAPANPAIWRKKWTFPIKKARPSDDIRRVISNRTTTRGPLIGLDIGSFAVRAAEVSNDGGRPTLHRFAQVTLPPGAVSDGEVVDAQVVSAALRRLWSDGGFSSRRVVVGVSSQRVIVRQADVTAMSEDELRSALNFEAQELIPIPVDEAVLDFQVIDPVLPSQDPNSPPNMRILLAAAQRDMVSKHMAAIRAADLDVVAVDPVALAMLRAVPAAPIGFAEAIVSIGSDLTTIAIREGNSARFVRVLNIGGADLTDALSRELSVNAQSAEDMKRRAANGAPVAVAAQAQSALSLRMGGLVDEIRGSLDFFLAQTDTEQVGRVILTGGAIQTDGLVARLEMALGASVEVANPLAAVTVGKTGLSEVQLRQSAPYMLAPVGLALWGTGTQRAISLMPKEVMAARRQRQQAGIGVVAVGAVVGLLAVVTGVRAVQVTQAHHHATTAQATVTSLETQKATFDDVAAVYNSLQTRQQLYVTAVGHDVDWVNLLNQITTAMPADVTITSFSAQRPSVAPAGAATSASAQSLDGSITINATAKGGHESVANWLRSLATIPGLQNAWVESSNEGTTATGKVVTFNSDASVTPAAESNRAQTIGGTK